MTKQEALAAFAYKSNDGSNLIVRHRRSGKRYLLNRDIVDAHRDSDGPRVYVYGFPVRATDQRPYWSSDLRAVWFYLESVDPA